MSSIPAEAPPYPLPSREQIEILSQTLASGFKSGRQSAGSLRRRLAKAKLDAMRLAPIPPDSRKALARAHEAARLARDVGTTDGTEPDDAATADEARTIAAEARALARTVIARARRAVRPGSREDGLMARLQTGLADDTAGVDISA